MDATVTLPIHDYESLQKAVETFNQIRNSKEMISFHESHYYPHTIWIYKPDEATIAMYERYKAKSDEVYRLTTNDRKLSSWLPWIICVSVAMAAVLGFIVGKI